MYIKVLSAKQLREADENAERLYGIGEELLIENAASALFSECGKVESAVIFAGPGNNGADGIALARRLHLAGTEVEILTLKPVKNKNAEIAEKLGIKISDFYERNDKKAELYVDALFGTGLSRPIEGKAREMLDYFNSRKGFKLAVDIPSGTDADTGGILGASAHVDKTVTFAFAKAGLFLYPGADCAGEVIIKDISLPDTIGDAKRYIMNSAVIKRRARNTHKGSYGHLLTVCGAADMSGAANMSAAAAVKSGCGLLTAAVPDVIRDAVACGIPEAMVCPLPSQDGALFEGSLSELKKHFDKATVLLIGCGIRNTEKTAYLVREAVKGFKGSRVIDADGLNVLCDYPEYLKGAVITPHPGEMARLMKCDIASVERDRVGSAAAFAEKYDCTVVLKGARTVTAYSDGRAYINILGNPGMANGGSGDVLAGLIASFLTQEISDAVQTAVYIHSLAGDMAAEKYCENAMSASDIIKMIPQAIKSVYGTGKMCAE